MAVILRNRWERTEDRHCWYCRKLIRGNLSVRKSGPHCHPKRYHLQCAIRVGLVSAKGLEAWKHLLRVRERKLKEKRKKQAQAA